MLRALTLLLVLPAGCDHVFGLSGAELECPMAFQSTGYVFVNNPVPWTEAEASCQLLRTTNGYPHLAVLSDDAELAALQLASSPVWVGLNDRQVEGFHGWITDEPVGMVPWATGQPNENPPPQDCVTATEQGLEDTNCQELVAYVCECDAFPVDPSRF